MTEEGWLGVTGAESFEATEPAFDDELAGG